MTAGANRSLRAVAVGCAAAAVLATPLIVVAEPLIAPVPSSEWSDTQQQIVASLPGPLTNAVATYLHHPVLAANLIPFERYITAESSLAARDRALLILRTAWLCRSDYIWAQHAEAARDAGVTDAELARIAHGPEAPGWEPIEAALLRATDELYRDDFVSDETWAVLAGEFDTRQLLDILTAIGGYRMFSMAINTFGVQLDANMTDARFPPHLR